MTAVIDSSALIALARVNVLYVLPNLFGAVLLPGAVQSEVLHARRAAPDVPRVLAAIAERLIAIRQIRAPSGSDPRLSRLGAGERETILLAVDAGADTVTLDDRSARREALRLGLDVVGTVGVLTLARDEGHIAAVAPLLEALRDDGFYLAPALVEDARRGDPD